MGPRAIGACPADGRGTTVRCRILVRFDPGRPKSSSDGCAIAVRVPGRCLPHHRALLEDLHWTGDEGQELWEGRETVPAVSGQDPEHWLVETVPDLCQGDESRIEYTQVGIIKDNNWLSSDAKNVFLISPREKLAQAYDFALEKIGLDLHSYSIWTDYIQFLKSVDAVGSYAENQKITAVRKVYQKAVLTPIIGIETLWKEYIAFEHNINPIISEKMSLERSRDYMNARRVAKELEIATKGLNRNLPAVPPTLNKEELKQVSSWKLFCSDSFDWYFKEFRKGKPPVINLIDYVSKDSFDWFLKSELIESHPMIAFKKCASFDH